MLKALCALLLPLCALWGGVQALQPTVVPSPIATAVELPSHWNGQPLRPLALSPLEARFARHFPGHIARMTDGTRQLVLRSVQQPTRMLHPAADCYQALGYRIRNAQLEMQASPGLWRCFSADKAGQKIRVCEQIRDAQGQVFTDTSAWYWAGITGQSTGPWQAVTVATPL
jgi:hypothetical protein